MNTSYHTTVAYATNVSERETPPNSAARSTLSNAPVQVASTKRAYTGRTLIERGNDYAIAHNITIADLARRQWELVDYQNRPAFKFKTDTGYRYRFLDEEGGYKSDFGVTACLYGNTPDVIELAKEKKLIIFSNGEISTVTGQTYLLPVICVTSGEKPLIRHDLFEALTQVLPHDVTILIVYDCDPTGQHAGAGVSGQFIEAGYDARAIDLGLSEGGDLADACGLYGSKTLEYLLQCATIEPRKPQIFTPRVMPAARTSKPANLSPDAEAKRRENFDNRWNGAISNLERTSRGRNPALLSHACLLFDLVYTYGYESESAASSALYNACIVNGYLAKDGAHAVKSTIKSALDDPRQTLDMPHYDKPAPRRESSAQAEISKYDTVHPDKDNGIVADALPDAMIKHGLKVWGLSIVSEITLLLYAMARGQLPSIFFQEDRNAIPGATPANKNTYTVMLKLGILRKVESDLIPDLALYLSSDVSRAKSRNNSRGRKQNAYQLVSIDELKRLMFQPMAGAFVSLGTDEISLIEESLKPLMRQVLERLLKWKTPLQSIHIGLVQSCLKPADKYRAAEVFEAIETLPITDAALVSYMGLEAAAESIQALSGLMHPDMVSLIDLKNRLLLRLYETHKDSLDNPTITPLPENAPRIGEAWLDALYNARLLPNNGGYLWAHELNARLGIDDKNTAKRHAARAGIKSMGRYDTRPFTVPLIEGTPTWDAVKRSAKEIAKHEDRALDGRIQRNGLIRSYDENGREVGKAEYSEIDHPDGFDIGGRFTVELQLRNLITVSDAESLADAIESDAMPETAAVHAALVQDEQVENTPAQSNAKAAKNTHNPRPNRRITPARLHDKNWLLERLLAPFCFSVEKGVWFNPLNPDTFNDEGEIEVFHLSAVDTLADIQALLAVSAKAAS